MKTLYTYMLLAGFAKANLSTYKRIPGPSIWYDGTCYVAILILIEYVPDSEAFTGDKYLHDWMEMDLNNGVSYVFQFDPPNVIDSTCERIYEENRQAEETPQGGRHRALGQLEAPVADVVADRTR